MLLFQPQHTVKSAGFKPELADVASTDAGLGGYTKKIPSGLSCINNKPLCFAGAPQIGRMSYNRTQRCFVKDECKIRAWPVTQI